MDTLPYEIKRYEILPLLDSVSKMVLRHVLLNKPYRHISTSEMNMVVGYGLKYAKYFYKQKIIFLDDLWETAASAGNLELLRWCLAKGCDWNHEICWMAALNGHLEVLQWARANGCYWDSHTCACAARNGHLEILQWARANGCDWNAQTCTYAAMGGHLEILQWAQAHRCKWNAEACLKVAARSNPEILQWCRDNWSNEY